MAKGKRINRRNWYFFLFLFLVLVGISVNQLLFGRITRFRSSYYSSHYTTSIYPLIDNAQIAQGIVSKYSGLYRIDLFFRKRGDIEGDIIFYLKRDSCEAVESIDVISVEISDIIDGEPFPFTFSPIDDSMGHKFCVVVEAQSSASQGQLGVYVSPIDVYAEGEGRYKRNGLELQEQEHNPVEQVNYRIWLPIIQSSTAQEIFDIGFRAHYNLPTSKMIIPVLMQLSANKPYLLGSPLFYLFWLVTYVVVVVVFLGFILDPKNWTKSL